MTDDIRELAERVDRLPEWEREQVVEIIALLLQTVEERAGHRERILVDAVQ